MDFINEPKTSKDNVYWLRAKTHQTTIIQHKEANYKVYKTFLEHVATEVDNEIETVELRVSDKIEFGSNDEKALTKAIEHVFPLTERLLCTKHLKDNIKHYCQNKMGMPKNDREMIMAKLFAENGLADANSTVDFDAKSHELESSTKQKYPVFAKYFETNLEPRLRKHVFQPNRKRYGEKMWTNNNAESLNNILKLSMDWRPKSTQELIQKLHNVTKLQFSDYRSALHDTGNIAWPALKGCTLSTAHSGDANQKRKNRKYSMRSYQTKRKSRNRNTSHQRMENYLYLPKQQGLRKSLMPASDH